MCMGLHTSQRDVGMSSLSYFSSSSPNLFFSSSLSLPLSTSQPQQRCRCQCRPHNEVWGHSDKKKCGDTGRSDRAKAALAVASPIASLTVESSAPSLSPYQGHYAATPSSSLSPSTVDPQHRQILLTLSPPLSTLPPILGRRQPNPHEMPRRTSPAPASPNPKPTPRLSETRRSHSRLLLLPCASKELAGEKRRVMDERGGGACR